MTSSPLGAVEAAGPVPVDEAGEVVSAYGLSGFPFAGVVAALFVIVLLRAQGTFWLGRGIAAGTIRSPAGRRLALRLSGPGLSRAVAFLNRFGLVAVPLSFLTVGLQTMVNAAAGLMRMPWPRYTAAMIPGCVAWAFIYATVGMTAFYAAVAAAAGSPWGVTIVVVLAGLVVGIVLHRRRWSAGRAPGEDGSPHSPRTVSKDSAVS